MGRIFFEKVYQIVKKIPVGKVTTYGLIARWLVTNPRVVGWALHANRDHKVPCHRVVNQAGRLAPGFAFGGPKEQRKRLRAEGISFEDETHVDLEKYLWRIK